MEIKRSIPGLVIAALLAAFPGESRAQDESRGLVDRIGARFEDTLRDVQREFGHLSEEVQRRFAQARAEAESLGVAARVYSRIRWDKALSQSPIAVEIRNDQTAVLTGSVADEAARTRAGDLAEQTVGVTGVENQLRIDPPETAPPSP